MMCTRVCAALWAVVVIVCYLCTKRTLNSFSFVACSLCIPPQAMDYFGASVAGIGDVDGDGMEDMVVGALGDDETALNAGR